MMHNNNANATLVLNVTFEPINVIEENRAVVLLLLGKAESLLDTDRICGSATEALMYPSVIKLMYLVNVPRVRQVPLSRRALFRRDGFTCQYCGLKTVKLEVEHVIPRAQGGRNLWTNVVTSCRECNAKKRDRTPEQAGMKLLSKPYAPTQLAMIASRGHKEWEEYLR